MTYIPTQLQHEEFRFCLIPQKEKRPFEKEWQKNGYKYSDLRLLHHLRHNENYGVIGGYGRLRILDIDQQSIAEELYQKLDTFTVKTGSRGYHFYFLSDYAQNQILSHPLKGHVGELRANNYQVVGPSSIHPNGNTYTVINNSNIKEITIEELEHILQDYRHKKNTTFSPPLIYDQPKDETRSGKEFRELLRLHREGKTKEEAFAEMMVYAKWSSEKDQYREYTYTKVLEYAKNLPPLKPTDGADDFEKGIETFVDYFDLAEKFYALNPLIYDKNKLWWLWNKQEYRWEIADETDIMNKIDSALKKRIVSTLYSQVRSQILESLKRIGRTNHPKKPLACWIQFKDTIYDFETEQTFPASPNYLFTNPVPWKIGESEETPNIDRLFREWVVQEGVQDQTYVQTLYEITAYTLLNVQPLQRLFALTGSGSNGKSCFLRLLTKFAGEENTCTSELGLLTSRNFETAALYKKIVCFMGEVSPHDLKNTNILKRLTGEDPIRYEFKGKTPFSEKSSCKIVMATNSLPVTPEQSQGFYRRWLIVDFPNQFEIGKDPLLSVPSEEFENLAKKCLKIIPILLGKMAFTNQGDIPSRTEKYEKRANPLTYFIQEYYTTEDPDAHVSFLGFYEDYVEYLRKNRQRKISKNVLSHLLRVEGFCTKRLHPDGNHDISLMAILGIKKNVEACMVGIAHPSEFPKGS